MSAADPDIKHSDPSRKTPPVRPDYMRSVDQRLKQLSADILPEHPYILHAPSKRPFHLGSQFVTNWAVGKNCFFAPEEDSLQYLTFKRHAGADSSLLPVGGWADEAGQITDDQEHLRFLGLDIRAMPKPGGHQEQQQQQSQVRADPLKKRVKISFSDYKKKAMESQSPPSSSSRSNTTEPPTAAASDGATRNKGNPQANGQNTKEASKPASKQPVRLNAQDRRSSSGNDTDRTTISKRPPPDPSNHPNSPPRKKPCPPANERREEKKEMGLKAVPQLLSPTLPSNIDISLPPLLSPTLPPDIEDDLAHLPRDIANPEKHPHRTDSNSSALVSSNAESDHKPSKAHPKPSQAVKTTADKQKPTLSGKRPAISSSSSTTTASGTLKPSIATSSTLPKKPTEPLQKRKLIVKLKYGKQNRKRAEALLRISAKRRPASTANLVKPGSLLDPILRGRDPIKKTTMPQPPKAPERSRESSIGMKRPNPSDGSDTREPELKRQKSTSSLAPIKERPIESKNSPSALPPPASKSLAAPTPKEQFLSPQKDVKAARRRAGSTDSGMKTPAGDGPGSVKMSPAASGDGQTSETRDSQWRSWREEFNRFIAMGRELKHEWQPTAIQKQATASIESLSDAPDSKLRAVTAVESLLCFIMAFILENRLQALKRQVGESSGWGSIIAYWQAVLNITAPYPHLHGLCLHLGAICHESIHALDLERLAVSSLPGDHSPAPTPRSDGTTITTEETKKQRREFHELKVRLPESFRAARRLWLDGSRELSTTVLSRKYPKSWNGREQVNMEERGREQLKLGGYGGTYYLPLSSVSMPIESVRFGLNFLREWSENENITWKGKLHL